MAYSEAEQARGQRAMILEGVFSRAMDGFTGGVLLAGFALSLGASDLEIGLLAAIPMLANVAHLPAVSLLHRFPDRRPLVVGGGATARLPLFVMAALPFLDLPVRPIDAMLTLLVASAILATLSGAGWQVWVRELVPRAKLGAYFGTRMIVLSVVGLVVLLVAGFAAPRVGYPAMFVLGGACGLASCIVLSRAPSARSAWREMPKWGASIRRPFHDANYRRVLLFLGAWGFAANLALPFVTVVLLRTMGYALPLVAGLAALSQVANIGGLRLWAPLTDRFGNKPVLGLSGAVFVLAMLSWALVPKTPDVGALVAIAAIHALLGFALAGLDVASNGLVMKLAPDDEIPAYLSSASLVKAVTAGVAPLLAGVALTALGDRSFAVRFEWAGAALTGFTIHAHEFLFLASVLLGLYALHRLLGFREEGEAPPETVMRAMRRDVSTPSSIAGIRAFAHLASYVVEAAYRFERALTPRDPG